MKTFFYKTKIANDKFIIGYSYFSAVPLIY